ncbi:hypothetical protein GCM10011360_21890 [Primorskyibacter flagellatus]|uniref:Cytochrome C oxidase assembly protein n=1 Tax=Primorskyibacter flagellatus TaxID=1387277 RepID=A0A917A8S0_9RHOB|nr:hypothetical protein [Primorskyibacter flagellatus]GGE33664.1 hypothetical protein GCM10011360_21890 [Primorskyibacter flagellatus]
MTSFREPHELHKRRFGRNLGLGLVLAIFVSLVFGLTIVKVSQNPITVTPQAGTAEGN